MMSALVRLPLARVASARLRWLGVLPWALLAILSAVVLRARGGTSNVDAALLRSFGPIALPLLAYAASGLVLPSGSLAASAAPLVFLGAAPRRAALAIAATGSLVAGLLGGLLAAIVVVLAHGSADPPLLGDALRSFGVGALGGAAYGAYFSFGATFLRGQGRSVLLVLDLILGGYGAGALFSPRGHVRALLGGSLAAELTPRTSSVILIAMGLFFLGLASLRSSRE